MNFLPIISLKRYALNFKSFHENLMMLMEVLLKGFTLSRFWCVRNNSNNNKAT